MATISSRIQKNLTLKIINGELTPGHKLDEQALAVEFGVSRTPIREALRELGAKGLIDIMPHRGAVVASISIDQLADMFDAECELEALCARLASQRMSAVERGALQECHLTMKEQTKARNEERYLALNATFHDLICRGAHNKTLEELTQGLRARLAPFRQSQSRPKPMRLTQSFDEHVQIVEAILTGDQDAAYDAMRRHNARLSSAILGLLKTSSKD